MDTKEYLSKIVPTVKDLLLAQGYEKESEILQIGNITYNENKDTFGNVYCSIVIDVQTDKYVELKKRYKK